MTLFKIEVLNAAGDPVQALVKAEDEEALLQTLTLHGFEFVRAESGTDVGGKAVPIESLPQVEPAEDNFTPMRFDPLATRAAAGDERAYAELMDYLEKCVKRTRERPENIPEFKLGQLRYAEKLWRGFESSAGAKRHFEKVEQDVESVKRRFDDADATLVDDIEPIRGGRGTTEIHRNERHGEIVSISNAGLGLVEDSPHGKRLFPICRFNELEKAEIKKGFIGKKLILTLKDGSKRTIRLKRTKGLDVVPPDLFVHILDSEKLASDLK